VDPSGTWDRRQRAGRGVAARERKRSGCGTRAVRAGHGAGQGRTWLGRAQERRGKAVASVGSWARAGPAAGGGEVAVRACRSRAPGGVPGSRGARAALFQQQTGGAESGRVGSRSTRTGAEEQQRGVRQQLVCKQHGVQDLLPCGLGVAVRSSTGGGPVWPDLGPRGVAAGGEGGGVKASRPLIRVLVINDNGLWINNSF
jgi:hypothetical protein